MIRNFVYFAVLISTVYGAGELSILHHPSSLVFIGHDHLKESTLAEIYSASLGLPTEQYSNWQGLYIYDPFNLAEALVTVAVIGIASIYLQKGHHYPLKTDSDDESVYDTMERRLLDWYPESNSELVEIDLFQGIYATEVYDIFKNIKSVNPEKTPHNFLNLTVDEDREFLEEITLLNSIAAQIEQNVVQRDFVPDIYWFRVSGLDLIVDLYGENSTTTKEAQQLLNDAILRLNNAFSKAYMESVLVNVITSDATHTRRVRSILATED